MYIFLNIVIETCTYLELEYFRSDLQGLCLTANRRRASSPVNTVCSSVMSGNEFKLNRPRLNSHALRFGRTRRDPKVSV